MMRIATRWVCWALTTSALWQVPAHATDKDRRVLTPNGPWSLEYADDACRLARNLSDGEGQVTVAFERFEIGPALRVGFAGDGLSAWSNVRRAAFHYLPNGEERESDLHRSQLADGREAFLIASGSLLSPAQREEIGKKWQGSASITHFNDAEVNLGADMTAIVITEGLKDALEFRIGPMSEPLKALQACAVDLVQSWGVDPAAVASMSRAPEPTSVPAGWLTTADYPAQMLRENRSGVVQLRLIVSAEGKVESCRFEVEMPDVFEQVACKGIVARARFRPALDASGKPMRTYWRQRIIFQP